MALPKEPTMESAVYSVSQCSKAVHFLLLLLTKGDNNPHRRVWLLIMLTACEWPMYAFVRRSISSQVYELLNNTSVSAGAHTCCCAPIHQRGRWHDKPPSYHRCDGDILLPWYFAKRCFSREGNSKQNERNFMLRVRWMLTPVRCSPKVSTNLALIVCTVYKFTIYHTATSCEAWSQIEAWASCFLR